MDGFMDLLNTYRVLLGTLLLTLATLVVMKVYWEEVRLFWIRLVYGLPVIGRTSRYSKDLNLVDRGGVTWFGSEERLCNDFELHYDKLDKDGDFFDDCNSYLKKATEKSRKKLPVILAVLLLVFVFAEALGFSYVLAGFTVPGASENVQQIGAALLAMVISLALVAFTHFTGAELYHNSLISKVRDWARQGRAQNLTPNTEIGLENTNDDDGEPNYQQLLNRICEGANSTVSKKHAVTIFTAFLILSVAIGATFVRSMVLDRMLSEEQQIMREDVGGAYSTNDPYSSLKVPAGPLTEGQDEANMAAVDDMIHTEKLGGWGTFAVLAVLFVAIQIIGILIGFKYGFGGDASREAYGYVHKFNTRKEFENYHNRKKGKVSQIAQKHLSALQKKIDKRAGSHATEQEIMDLASRTKDRTFLTHIELRDLEEKKHNKNRMNADIEAERSRIQAELERQSYARSVEDMQKTLEAQRQTETIAQAPVATAPAAPAAEEGDDLAARIARIKQRSAEKVAEKSEEQRMAEMSDEELEVYLREKGEIS